MSTAYLREALALAEERDLTDHLDTINFNLSDQCFHEDRYADSIPLRAIAVADVARAGG